MKNVTTPNNSYEVLLPRDLETILHVGRKKVRSLLANGSIRSVKIGNSYRIPRSSLDEFLNAGISVKEEQL